MTSSLFRRRPRSDYDDAKAEADGVATQAGQGLIETESPALFATVDAGDLFGDPGDGLAWMKQNVKAMVGQLAGIRKAFDIPKRTAGPLCDCFKKIQTWINGPADVKDNFDKDVFSTKQPVSTSRAVAALTKLYCPP